MAAKRAIEPILWILFSAGGVISAMLIPVLLFLFGLAFPLGWLATPEWAHVLGLFGHPIGRLTIVALCTLSLMHWAHRFRYTLYDGLQIKHLNEIVATFCYGGAVVGSIIAAVLVWQIP